MATEAQRAASRRYREANRETINERARQYRQRRRQADPDRCREQANERAQRYRESHRDELAAKTRQRNAATRAAVFAHYGQVCACCGIAEDLTIDHIDGNGRQHREEVFGQSRGSSSDKMYRWLVKNGFPEGFSVLCLPCNTSKKDGPACRLDHVKAA